MLCSAYESLLQWVGNHSHFTITAHRHVWSFPYAFYLTSAIVRDNATDERGSPAVPVNSAVDPYHVMRPGIFLTQEHRVGQPPPNVILIPFYSPPFFLFAGDEPRRTLLTSSSHHMTHCHRFDLFPSTWHLLISRAHVDGPPEALVDVRLALGSGMRQLSRVPSGACPTSSCSWWGLRSAIAPSTLPPRGG